MTAPQPRPVTPGAGLPGLRALASRLLARGHCSGCVLALIAALYVFGYLALPATPGNAPLEHPQGWWGWFDQGQYLKGAHALRARDFSPASHFYPPLYPALGALFLPWSSGHPFFLVNLACLLWFANVFLRLARRRLPGWAAAAVLLGTTVLDPRIFENFLIPWTTSLSAALLSAGLLAFTWMEELHAGERQAIRAPAIFGVALALGLVVPTRPPDAVVAAWIALALLAGYVHTLRLHPERLPRPATFAIASALGLCIGPMLFFAFNQRVFGGWLGGYLQANSANGMYFADLPEKFVSIWRDGTALYGEPGAGLLQRLPWLYLGLPGLAFALLRGPWTLRAVAVAVTLLQLLYLPFGDLLPTGLWRYMNIHYFKWTLPYLGLFGVLLALAMAQALRARRWADPALLAGVAGLALLSGLGLRLQAQQAPLSLAAGQRMAITLPAGETDFVDLPGLTGGFTETYFGEHRVWADGHEMRRYGEFRLLPLPGGTRLLFIRPLRAGRIEFAPDPRLALAPQTQASAGTYRFTLGWRRRPGPALVTPAP